MKDSRVLWEETVTLGHQFLTSMKKPQSDTKTKVRPEFYSESFEESQAFGGEKQLSDY